VLYHRVMKTTDLLTENDFAALLLYAQKRGAHVTVIRCLERAIAGIPEDVTAAEDMHAIIMASSARPELVACAAEMAGTFARPAGAASIL